MNADLHRRMLKAHAITVPILAALLSLLLPAFARGQQLSRITLQQALKIALEKNPARKAALADTKAASAGVREARSSLLPHILFSETITDGNDPVYVFGSKLREQRFTNADLALNVLNTPTPLTNFATGFGGTWNLFDSFSSWHAVNRAERARDAAGQQLARTDQEVVFRVIDSYYAVLLAKSELQVAQQAMTTAQSILDRSKNRVDAGVAVESDYLTAQVRLATRKQELLRAQNNVWLARAQLSTAMGMPAASEFDPGDTLAEKTLPPISLDDAEKLALQKRPDLLQVRSEEAAQQQSVAMAKASFGPRVNAFANWEADNPTFVSGGGGNNWTAGVAISFDIFQGGAKRAQLAREEALKDKIAASREQATNAIQLQVRRAYYEVDSARQQIDVTRSSISESQESLRLNQNRYDAGLVTITDLLASEDTVRRAQTDYLQALYEYYTGYANLELASGTLSLQSPVVMP
jgi:outer membrane protein